jgi:hypothetical protein
VANEPPSGIVPARHADLARRDHEVWARRALLLLPLAIVALALANVFGQRATTSSAVGAPASLELRAPSALRAGLLYQMRFRITVRSGLRNAQIVLDPGWLDGITVNTTEPAAESETSDDGRLVFAFGPLDAGRTFTYVMAFQVNPTTYARRTLTASLDDAGSPVTSIKRTLTIFP